MRHIRFRYFVLFVLTAFCLSSYAHAKADPDPKHKKKLPVSALVPEPDALPAKCLPHRDLKSADEAVSPLSADFIFREGIDVSHYQSSIDWPTVARDGKVGYVYLKATEGSSLEDDTYEYNIAEARKAGLKVGSYHLFRVNASVDEQVANMTSKVKPGEQDLLPFVDIEHTGGASKDVLLDRLKEFLDKLTKFYGRKPMIYTFVNFYNRYFAGSGLDDYKFMVAFYRDDKPELDDGRRYAIWQYTSHGRMPGIRGNVDRSILMDGFTYNDLRY